MLRIFKNFYVTGTIYQNSERPGNILKQNSFLVASGGTDQLYSNNYLNAQATKKNLYFYSNDGFG